MSDTLPPTKSVYLHYALDDGCRYHRLLQPARFLGQDLPGVALWCQNDPPRDFERHDAYVIHGLPFSDTLARASNWQRKGAAFVWSLDDDFLTVPDWNPAKPVDDAMGMYLLARSSADWIMVSTAALAETFGGRWANKVLLTPNLMDISQYPTPEPAPVVKDQILRVCWAGGPTHKKDLGVMVPALQRLLDKHMDKFEVIFFGGQAPPPELLTSHLHKGVYWHPPVALNQYWAVLSAHVKPHVFLAPLAEVPFNLSKSAIRVYEGWCLSAAVLCTPWGEYRCVRDGEDGLWCRDPEEWEANLERVILDHQFREGLARAGRKRIETEHNWQHPPCRQSWREAFHKVVGNGVANGHV